MLRLFLLISALLFINPWVAAQTGSISGKITDGKQALELVNVYLVQAEKGTVTNEKGNYEIKGIQPGTYTLRVSYVGYRTAEKIIKIDDAEDLVINISLSPESLNSEEIVVTGTMRRTYVKDSPVKVEVMKAEQLQQGKTSANIMDLISSVSGLNTQLNCGVCGTNAIRINGVEGPNTAVLIDGMPVMGALASVYGLNGISPSIIDQVEVIKGPQSTLYGTQALGGVVNIITKNPENTPTFSADVYGKSTEEGNINVAYSPSSERFSGFISGSILRLENYFDRNDDNFNDLIKQTRASLFAKGSVSSPEGIPFLNIVTKLYSENRTGGLEYFTDSQRGSGQIYGESIYTNRFEFLSEFIPIGMGQRLKVNTALTHHDQDSYYGTDWYDARQSIVFGQITLDQNIGEELKLLTGSTVRYELYDDNTPATANGADQRWIPGIFTQAEWSLNEVTLLGGVRIDHHQEHGVVTAPRASVKYSPTFNTTFRLSAGTGFRVVNVFTEDHAALTGSREVVFAEDLAPEESKSVTASLEQIIPFGTNPLTVTIDGFYTHFSNKIIPDYEEDQNLIVYENLDGFSVTRGFSFGLEQSFTFIPLTYNAGVTVMDVFTEEDGRREALEYAPEYTGVFGLNYNVRVIDLSIGYSGNLVGPKKMPDSYAHDFSKKGWSPSYSTHDIKITKEFSNVNGTGGVGFEAYVSAENVFNYTQDSPLVGASDPFGPDFDTIYTWGPIVGRTFTFGARINLR